VPSVPAQRAAAVAAGPWIHPKLGPYHPHRGELRAQVHRGRSRSRRPEIPRTHELRKALVLAPGTSSFPVVRTVAARASDATARFVTRTHGKAQCERFQQAGGSHISRARSQATISMSHAASE